MNTGPVTVLTMIADEIIPLGPYDLILLKLEGEEISSFRLNDASIEDLVLWIGNLKFPVFVYDASAYESYQVEKYMVDEDKLILFTFDTVNEESELEYRSIKLDENWYVAFKDGGYGDFVIDFSHSFASKEDADKAALSRAGCKREYRIIQADGAWYVAFKDSAYGDFVIEFSRAFSSYGEADEAAKANEVVPNYDGDGK